MDFIVVEGVRPWDGRYEFDLDGSPFTTREWGWIKRLANYMPLTIDQGWKGGDPELFSAFAVIALFRAGKLQPADVPDVFDRFADAPFGGTIRLETDQVDQEDDASPPVLSMNGSSSISGPVSPGSSETSEPTQPASGTPDWASLASHHTRLPT